MRRAGGAICQVGLSPRGPRSENAHSVTSRSLLVSYRRGVARPPCRMPRTRAVFLRLVIASLVTAAVAAQPPPTLAPTTVSSTANTRSRTSVPTFCRPLAPTPSRRWEKVGTTETAGVA